MKKTKNNKNQHLEENYEGHRTDRSGGTKNVKTKSIALSRVTWEENKIAHKNSEKVDQASS